MAGANVILDSPTWRKAEAQSETTKLYMVRKFDNMEYSDSIVRTYPLEIICKSNVQTIPLRHYDDSEKLGKTGNKNVQCLHDTQVANCSKRCSRYC